MSFISMIQRVDQNEQNGGSNECNQDLSKEQPTNPEGKEHVVELELDFTEQSESQEEGDALSEHAEMEITMNIPGSSNFGVQELDAPNLFNPNGDEAVLPVETSGVRRKATASKKGKSLEERVCFQLYIFV